jgi:hypothetical protein
MMISNKLSALALSGLLMAVSGMAMAGATAPAPGTMEPGTRAGTNNGADSNNGRPAGALNGSTSDGIGAAPATTPAVTGGKSPSDKTHSSKPAMKKSTTQGSGS